MENKYIFWISGIVIVAALVVFGVRYVSDDQPIDSQNESSTTTQTVTTTLSQSPSSQEDRTDNGTISEREGESNAVQEASKKRAIPEPSIAISPYSVYIGFATSVGTSSESLMQKEVSKVVIGYEWEALLWSPMFSTVTLPEWAVGPEHSEGILSEDGQQKEYSVYVWDKDSYILLGDYSLSDEIKFPRDGLRGASRFKFTGIDPALGICPGDRSFTWNVRFTFSGTLGLIRTPITQDLPQGETCRMR